MANRNYNVSSEIEPRVLRHPTPALTETVPTVPEVSLAFDTPQQRNYYTNEPRSSNVPTTYAQWKQQVPQKSSYNNNIDAGIVQKISHCNSSAESPRRPNTGQFVSMKKPQNQLANTFTKDSRLKFYQKISPGPSPSEIKTPAITNPLNNISTSPRELERSLSVGSQPQKIMPSDLVLKDKLEMSLNPQERMERVKSTCDYHSHQPENTEIINKLLSLVQSQNTQIQMLQGQVETLLSIQNDRSREINDYQRIPLPHHNVSTNTLDQGHQNPRLQYPKSPQKIQEFDDKQPDDKCKQLIKEKKVSIGVMTSFELTVQDSIVYNVDTVPLATDHQEQTLNSMGNQTITTRTPAPVAKIQNGPLEQIIEDSESHLSSTLQATNNFHTYSSARKSLQGNFQVDLSTCMELPQINNSRNPIASANQVNNMALTPQTSAEHRLEAANVHKKFINEDNHSPIQQKQFQTLQAAGPSNPQSNSTPKDIEMVKKTPKVGWTLYDNVMGQVNEILHNTQEEEAKEQRQEIIQETNQSKLVLNGIQQSTVEQLKVFGFTFADTSGLSEGKSLVDNRRMHPIPIDASYYPRLDYQANVVQTSCSASDSNTSMHMKALAMKYLGTKQLPNVSNHQRGMELFTNMVLSNIQNNIPGTSVNEVSQIDHNPRFQGSPKALPDCQRDNYLIHSKQTPHNPHNPHNILDISSLKRQPKLL